jgi:hypothetical protein
MQYVPKTTQQASAETRHSLVLVPDGLLASLLDDVWQPVLALFGVTKKERWL